jgi:alcohol dehydrogenase YqhD (iron-dependent ADH family)
VNNFVYHNKTKLFFGKGVENSLGQEIKLFGAKSVLLVYGQQSIVKSGLLARAKDSLKNANIPFVEYGGVVANPLKQHMLKGIELGKNHGVDFVLAIGGGSVIDEAKGIAAGLTNDDVWQHYLDRSKPLSKALPVCAVLTLPATGTENSIASVIKDQDTGIKYGINAECIRPALAFVNPELCFSLPKYQISNGASDMLAHMMERYFSPQQNVTATDHLLKSGMQAVLEIAPKLYHDSANYQLWAEFCLLGTMAHNNMLSLGRNEQDWGSHILETTFLSGLFNSAHGAGLSIIFLAWLKLMSQKRPQKVLQFCDQVMEAKGNTDKEKIVNGIQKLTEFYSRLDLPTTLSMVKVDTKKIVELAEKIYNKDSKLGCYGELNLDDIKAIIELAK